jgi:hypothetical protein
MEVVVIDGKSYAFGDPRRFRSQQNLIVMPMTIQGKKDVVYLADTYGAVSACGCSARPKFRRFKKTNQENMAKKLFIRTFGCQMNEYDSDKMADVLAASEEIVKTDNPEDADIILFNTCSVREKAQERVFHDLGRVRLLKKDKPDLVIGVGGCVASQEGAAIVKHARPTSTSCSGRRPCIACRS